MRYLGSPQSGTGPPNDHTTNQDGYFVYANPRESEKEGDNARLMSAQYFTAEKAACAFPFEYLVSNVLNTDIVLLFNVLASCTFTIKIQIVYLSHIRK